MSAMDHFSQATQDFGMAANETFNAQAARMADLMQVIQHVAFDSIESRLASRLLALTSGQPELVITHQQLAAEIGTAREVVSRHLKAFEKRGWVALGRGRVALRNAAPLRAAAAQTGADAGAPVQPAPR